MWAPRSDAHTEDWSAGRDDSTMPWFAKMDYVEYYSYDEMDDSFDLKWRDDFKYLDKTKWKVSQNEGFDQNLATYMDTQVYIDVNAGIVLKMDHNPSAVVE